MHEKFHNMVSTWVHESNIQDVKNTTLENFNIFYKRIHNLWQGKKHGWKKFLNSAEHL